MKTRNLQSTIAANGVNGTPVSLGGDASSPRAVVAGVLLPDDFDKTSMTFETTFDGGTTWVAVKDYGAAADFTLDCTGSVDEFVPIQPTSPLCSLQTFRPACATIVTGAILTFVAREA